MEAIIVAGFPGIGKSWFQNNSKYRVLDSDSSIFSWISKGVRNPDFPENYIKHIKDNLSKADIILVSTHKDVRNALVAAGLFFNLVYPKDTKAIKQEYLIRYLTRGSSPEFIKMMDVNWGKFQEELVTQVGCIHSVLEQGLFLKDILRLEE